MAAQRNQHLKTEEKIRRKTAKKIALGRTIIFNKKRCIIN